MNETQHIHKIMNKIQSVAGDDLWWHKVADAGSLAFSQPRAVDVLAFYKGQGIGIEWKLHKSKGKFPLNRFRQSQYDELERIAKSGSWALIIIGVYANNGNYQRLYILPFKRWLKGINNLTEKSICLETSFQGHEIFLTKTIDKLKAKELAYRLLEIEIDLL